MPTRSSDSFSSGVSAFKTALGSSRPSFSGSFMNPRFDSAQKRYVDLNKRFALKDYPEEIEIEADDEEELGDHVHEINKNNVKK